MQFSLTKSTVIHPILFAALPILLIVSVNLGEIVFDDIVLPFLIIIPSVIVLWFFLNLFVKNKMKSGLIISFGLFIFFSYGHFWNIWNANFDDFFFMRHRYILPSFIILFVIGTYFLLKIKKNPIEFTTIANVIAIVLILISIFNITTFAFENNNSIVFDDQINYDGSSAITLDHTPNVYYVILDGYTSSEVLKDIYDFDNQNFLSQLQARGFYIAENSHTNYAPTFLSVTSSLNMEHLIYLKDVVGVNSTDRKIPTELRNSNKVMSIFKSYNYTIVDLSQKHTSIKLSDYGLCKDHFITDEFQIILWESSILKPVFLSMFGTQEHRDKILCQFSELADLNNSIEEPFFVYAHFLLPHPPFVFGPNGEYRQPESLAPGDNIWVDRQSYVDQIQFENKKLIETIDKIFLESNSPPIIILQGDHGPGSLRGDDIIRGNNESDEFIRERMSIFNAYYFPDQNSKLIYDSITPVNSFRLILNEYFNENYEFLDDKNYFSDYKHSYNFTDVTERILLNTQKK